MPAAIDLSTAGVSLNYAVETTSGTRPTTGYTKLTGIKAIPDINPEPGSLETTTLDALMWRTYIAGLKDPGGALAFTANMTQQFATEWETLVTEANEGKETNLRTWFAIVVPGLTDAFYFAAEVSELGLSAIEVDSVLEIEPYLTPVEIHGWDTAPTAGE